MSESDSLLAELDDLVIPPYQPVSPVPPVSQTPQLAPGVASSAPFTPLSEPPGSTTKPPRPPTNPWQLLTECQNQREELRKMVRSDSEAKIKRRSVLNKKNKPEFVIETNKSKEILDRRAIKMIQEFYDIYSSNLGDQLRLHAKKLAEERGGAIGGLTDRYMLLDYILMTETQPGRDRLLLGSADHYNRLMKKIAEEVDRDDDYKGTEGRKVSPELKDFAEYLVYEELQAGQTGVPGELARQGVGGGGKKKKYRKKSKRKSKRKKSKRKKSKRKSKRKKSRKRR